MSLTTIIYICIAVISVIALIVLYITNFEMVFVTKYTVKSKRLPDSFDGYKILHLSDWHCTKYGKDNNRLIRKINNCDADIIVISGDLIVRQKKETIQALDFISKINSKPIYFTYGNHELALDYQKLATFREDLENLGVIVLDDEKTLLQRGNDTITLYGTRYNSNEAVNREKLPKEVVDMYMKECEMCIGKIDTSNFNILLTHDPLNFETYARLGFDVVYTGHLHGGGVRLFGYGFAKTTSTVFMTRLAAGKFRRYGTQMIVSRGIGNSTIKFRMFNPPEISVTTLKKS